MQLKEISSPFNAGQSVELKFELAPCHGIEGGELRFRVSPEMAKLYSLGDEFSIRMRLI